MRESYEKITVSAPFDELLKAAYQKMKIVKVSDKEAYFEKHFYPKIKVEGIICASGNKSEVEFKVVDSKLFTRVRKMTLITLGIFFLVIILSGTALIEILKILGFIVLGIGITLFVTKANQLLFSSIAESNIRIIIRKAANQYQEDKY